MISFVLSAASLSNIPGFPKAHGSTPCTHMCPHTNMSQPWNARYASATQRNDLHPFTGLNLPKWNTPWGVLNLWTHPPALSYHPPSHYTFPKMSQERQQHGSKPSFAPSRHPVCIYLYPWNFRFLLMWASMSGLYQDEAKTLRMSNFIGFIRDLMITKCHIFTLWYQSDPRKRWCCFFIGQCSCVLTPKKKGSRVVNWFNLTCWTGGQYGGIVVIMSASQLCGLPSSAEFPCTLMCFVWVFSWYSGFLSHFFFVRGAEL